MPDTSLMALKQDGPQNAIPSSESLDDLDDLLSESVEIATAKKLQKQGRQLSVQQKELLEANKIAAEIERWEAKDVYAHVCLVYCSCGSISEQFRGWYQYQEQKYGKGRRLIKTPDHDDLPAMKYTTEEVVTHCNECLAEADLNETELGNCDLLETLGASAAAPGYDGLLEVPSIDEPPTLDNHPHEPDEAVGQQSADVEVEDEAVTGEIEE